MYNYDRLNFYSESNGANGLLRRKKEEHIRRAKDPYSDEIKAAKISAEFNKEFYDDARRGKNRDGELARISRGFTSVVNDQARDRYPKKTAINDKINRNGKCRTHYNNSEYRLVPCNEGTNFNYNRFLRDMINNNINYMESTGYDISDDTNMMLTAQERLNYLIESPYELDIEEQAEFNCICEYVADLYNEYRERAGC